MRHRQRRSKALSGGVHVRESMALEYLGRRLGVHDRGLDVRQARRLVVRQVRAVRSAPGSRRDTASFAVRQRVVPATALDQELRGRPIAGGAQFDVRCRDQIPGFVPYEAFSDPAHFVVPCLFYERASTCERTHDDEPRASGHAVVAEPALNAARLLVVLDRPRDQRDVTRRRTVPAETNRADAHLRPRLAVKPPAPPWQLPVRLQRLKSEPRYTSGC